MKLTKAAINAYLNEHKNEIEARIQEYLDETTAFEVGEFENCCAINIISRGFDTNPEDSAYTIIDSILEDAVYYFNNCEKYADDDYVQDTCDNVGVILITKMVRDYCASNKRTFEKALREALKGDGYYDSAPVHVAVWKERDQQVMIDLCLAEGWEKLFSFTNPNSKNRLVFMGKFDTGTKLTMDA